MRLGAVVNRIFADRAAFIIECRHCGHTVDQTTDVCPECDRDEFARYDFPE